MSHTIYNYQRDSLKDSIQFSSLQDISGTHFLAGHSKNQIVVV